jgi:hypothetical protein
MTSSLQKHETARALRIWHIDGVVQRIGWLIMASFVVAALLGLLGPGPLSSRRLASENGRLIVEYSAVERYQAPSELRIRVLQPASPFELGISKAYLDTLEVEHITPPPASTETRGDALYYTFATGNDEQEVLVILRYQHASTGRRGAEVAAGAARVSIQQFVLP